MTVKAITYITTFTQHSKCMCVIHNRGSGFVKKFIYTTFENQDSEPEKEHVLSFQLEDSCPLCLISKRMCVGVIIVSSKNTLYMSKFSEESFKLYGSRMEMVLIQSALSSSLTSQT